MRLVNDDDGGNTTEPGNSFLFSRDGSYSVQNPLPAAAAQHHHHHQCTARAPEDIDHGATVPQTVSECTPVQTMEATERVSDSRAVGERERESSACSDSGQ